MKDKKKSCDNTQCFKTYLHHIDIDTNDVYSLSPQYYDSISRLPYALNLYKLKFNPPTHASAIQIRLYDNSGKFLYGWVECFGPLKHFHTLDSLPFKKTSFLPVNYDLSFQSDINLLDMPTKKHEQYLEELPNYDYVIMVLGAEWAGWYSKNTFKEVKKFIGRHADKKFLFIKVNTNIPISNATATSLIAHQSRQPGQG